MVTDGGATRPSGQDMREHGRHPAVLSIPVVFSSGPGEKADDGHDAEFEQHFIHPLETVTKAADRSRHTARHRGAPRRRLPGFLRRLGRAHATTRA